MLTEIRFKELYEQAERLRALGGTAGSAAAGELLLFLFDNGRSVGGYGVVRLSFVLRDLGALADLSNPHPGPDAQRIRRSLEKRRDEREHLATLGRAGFTDLQELVALHRALGEPGRSHDVYQQLETLSRVSDDIAAERKILEGLMTETALAGDAERIALQYELERLKRRLVELETKVLEALAEPAAAALEVLRLAAEVKAQCDRFRRADAHNLPRGEREKRDLAELAEASSSALQPHLERAYVGTAEDETTIRLAQMARQLTELSKKYGIRADLVRDREIRDQLLRQARETAAQIAEARICEDLPREGDPPPEARDEHGARILHDGLLAYEALLRIDEATLAERVAAWILAFRQTAQIYTRLAEAAGRARKPAVERRLREQAQRLSRG